MGKFVVVKVTVGLYSFTEPINSICIDRKQMMLSQIQVRRNLLKCTTDKLELNMAKKERERERN
jgi:hypothetical protein